MNNWIKVFVIFLVLSLGSCQTHRKKVITLAHGLDQQHSVHKAMLKLGEVLYQKSGGTMEVRVYPSQQLGAERELLELLQLGSVDITKVSAAVMENFVPEYGVFSVPYVFMGKEHAFTVLDGDVGRRILESGRKVKLHGLGYYDSGSRSFYTKSTPIEDPSDLEGLKIRVQESVTAMAMVEAIGGAPTPIAFGELYTALQAGVVDGAENNPPSFYLTRHYEVCRYYSINEHSRIPDVLLMSTHTWDRLNDQQRAWLEEAVKESVDFQRLLWQQSEQEALDAVKEHGVTVNYPDKEKFEEKVKDLKDSFQQDPLIRELLQAIDQLKP
ncbi:MAG: C4-dicarboxylate ABC transporter substrate-binding protein [Cyclobacteriaceae bacterium]|nr:MAG: C4-dicarboxylate ABC transporter substrate-binding protein [Cyclobacteriaceae bacterium]